jgi:hypothetical protein
MISKLKEALKKPWQPRDDGFEFSTEDVTPGCAANSSILMPKTSSVNAASPILRPRCFPIDYLYRSASVFMTFSCTLEHTFQ